MCWIIPLLVGLLSALLGYLLGKRCAGDSTTLVNLKDDNSNLREQLNRCETKKAQFITESEQLLAQQKESNTASNQQATATVEISEADVLTHAAYLALQDKYEQTQKTLSEQSVAKPTTLSDNEIKSHPTFMQLKSELEQAEIKMQQFKSDSEKSEEHNAQNAALISDLRAENQRITQSLKICQTDLAAAKTVTPTFDADAAKAVFGKKIKENDLTLVEGIGPKIAQLFIDAGISTWQRLGETDVASCQTILDNAGERYTIHNPGTWPRQAQLAANGEWQKLFDWQEKLDGGKE